MARERFLPVVIHQEICRGCGRCLQACNNNAINFKGKHRYVDYSKCKACAACTLVCPVNAITVISVYEGDVIDVFIDENKCKVESGCNACINACPNGVYGEEDGKITIDRFKLQRCVGCRNCETSCEPGALKLLVA
ncbi:MAG: 4Fe-4S binding protein [Promethearchaeota archaeon]